MKKFIAKIIFLSFTTIIAMLFINIFFLLKVSPQYLYSYDASILDKMERLQELESPKIILVGNSNLAFGIDSAKLEEAFHMNVINLGLHGSLGNEFHEAMAKGAIGEDDIVIVCHSDFDEYDRIVDPVLVWTVIENHYDLWKLVSLKEYPRMFMAFPSYMEKAYSLYKDGSGNQYPEGMYSRRAFNEYGDDIFPRGVNYIDYSNEVVIPEVGRAFVKRINLLNTYCEDRGATLLLAAYPICKGNEMPDTAEFVQFKEDLQNSVDCQMISDYTDYMIDYSYFCQGSLHLNDEGVQIRTDLLIHDIQKWREKMERD